MNEYNESTPRSSFDTGRGDVIEHEGIGLEGRRPIIVGSGTVPSEVVESRTDSGLTTADLAGRNQRATETPASPSGEAPQSDEPSGPLFSTDETRDFRARWDAIQVGFVDEPRRSVEQADNLVAETIKRLAEVFADERQRLEGQWTRGESVSTEDLRLALRRYRSFFGRLLSV